MTGRARAACLAAIALSSAAGCAGATRQIYTPADLRSELATRGAALPPADVVVPFELPPAALASARRLVRNANTDAQRVELLLAALFDPSLYGLRYESAATTTGAEAPASEEVQAPVAARWSRRAVRAKRRGSGRRLAPTTAAAASAGAGPGRGWPAGGCAASHSFRALPSAWRIGSWLIRESPCDTGKPDRWMAPSRRSMRRGR